jgi:hypothetical protein
MEIIIKPHFEGLHMFLDRLHAHQFFFWQYLIIMEAPLITLYLLGLIVKTKKDFYCTYGLHFCMERAMSIEYK